MAIKIEDILAALKDMKPEDKVKLSEALKPAEEPPADPPETPPEPRANLSETAKDKVIADLSERVNTLQTQVSGMLQEQATKGEDEFIALALCDPATKKGKIKPADESFWRQQYRDNPAGAKAILDKLPPILDLSVHGSGSGGKERRVFTEAEKKAAKKFNPKMTDEQIETMLSDE